MKKITTIIMAAVLSAVLASPVAGANFELGAKLGYSVPTGDHGDDWESGLNYGIYGQYNFTSNIAGQLSWTQWKSDWKHQLPPGVEIEKKSDVIHLNALYYFMQGSFRPYVTGGLDIVMWEVDLPDPAVEDLDETDYGFNLGAGLAYALTEKVKLGAEATYHYTDTKTADDEPGPDYNAQTWGFLATISYGF